MLAGEQLVTIGIPQLAHDLIPLSRLVARAREEDKVVVGELAGVGALQTARHETGVRYGVFAYETATVQIRRRRGLDPFHGKASRCNHSALWGGLVADGI